MCDLSDKHAVMHNDHVASCLRQIQIHLDWLVRIAKDLRSFRFPLQASRAAAADGNALPAANADAPSRRAAGSSDKLVAAQREVARLQAELRAVQEVDDAEIERLLQIIRESISQRLAILHPAMPGCRNTAVGTAVAAVCISVEGLHAISLLWCVAAIALPKI